MDTVEAISRDDIAAFFDRWYRPAAMVIAAAGRLDHAEHRRRGRPRALGERTGGELPQRSRPGGADAGRRRRGGRHRAGPPVPRVAQPRLDEDDDRWAMAVANQILGGGMSSRLFQEVREERGLAYSVYSHPTAFEDSGYLTVYCGTAPQRAREALGVIDDVVAGVLADGMTDTELAVASGYLEGSMLLGLEDSGGRMGRLGRSLMQRDRITTIDEHVARIRAVTIADVVPRAPPRARRPTGAGRGGALRTTPSSSPSNPTSAQPHRTVYAPVRSSGRSKESVHMGFLDKAGDARPQGGPGGPRRPAGQAEGRRPPPRAGRLDLRQAQGRLRRRRRQHRPRARRAGRPRGRARGAGGQGGGSPPRPAPASRPPAPPPPPAATDPRRPAARPAGASGAPRPSGSAAPAAAPEPPAPAAPRRRRLRAAGSAGAAGPTRAEPRPAPAAPAAG